MVKFYINVEVNDENIPASYLLKAELTLLNKSRNTRTLIKSRDYVPTETLVLVYDLGISSTIYEDSYSSLLSVYALSDQSEFNLVEDLTLDIDSVLKTKSRSALFKKINAYNNPLGIKTLGISINKEENDTVQINRDYEQDWFDIDKKDDQIVITNTESITPLQTRSNAYITTAMDNSSGSFKNYDHNVAPLSALNRYEVEMDNSSQNLKTMTKKTTNPLQFEFSKLKTGPQPTISHIKTDRSFNDRKENSFSMIAELTLKVANLEKENQKLRGDMKSLKLLLEEKQNEIIRVDEERENLKYSFNKTNMELLHLDKTFADYRGRVEKILKHVK